MAEEYRNEKKKAKAEADSEICPKVSLLGQPQSRRQRLSGTSLGKPPRHHSRCFLLLVFLARFLLLLRRHPNRPYYLKSRMSRENVDEAHWPEKLRRPEVYSLIKEARSCQMGVEVREVRG